MSTEIDRNVISITDRANTRFKLSARIDDLPPTVQALHLQDYLVLFDLETKAGLWDNVPKSKGRHKDLYAARFKELALEFFAQRGYVVRTAKAIWLPKSDNYKAYMQERESQKSKAHAAAVTWSAKTFAKLHFSLPGDDYVIENYEKGKLDSVHAYFIR